MVDQSVLQKHGYRQRMADPVAARSSIFVRRSVVSSSSRDGLGDAVRLTPQRVRVVRKALVGDVDAFADLTIGRFDLSSVAKSNSCISLAECRESSDCTVTSLTTERISRGNFLSVVGARKMQ